MHGTASYWGTSRAFSRSAAALIGVAFAFASTTCHPAGTLKVTSTEDTDSGSLRAAIRVANSSTQPHVSIELPAGTYELTRCGSDDDNTDGDLDITTSVPVTLVATGPDVIIRQSCAGERVLDDHGMGLLTLKGVTVTGGSLIVTSAAEPALGGGVRARGDVALQAASIEYNSATGRRGTGAPAGGAVVQGGAAYGGGLYVGGSLHAVDSAIQSNTASGGAGDPAPAAGGSAASGGPAEGGGAYVSAGIAVSGGSVESNSAIGGIGGSAPEASGGGGSARGGGLAQRTGSTGALSLSGTTLTANSAEGGGSGWPTATLATSVLAAGDATGGAVAGEGVLTVKNLTVEHNRAIGGATGVGGCLEGSACTSFGAAGAARGGALATSKSATVSSSAFQNNDVRSGRAFFTCFTQACNWYGVPASLAAGGAVWAGSALTIDASNFSENTATQGTGLPTLDGLAYGGAASSDAALSVTGGEYASNSVTEGHGGALSGKAVIVSGARFTANTASGRAGAIDANTLRASRIVASLNTAGGSGGGALASAGDATITDSDILSNSVNTLTAVQSPLYAGGGILVGGHLAIARSDVSDNSGRATYRPNFMLGPLLRVFTGGGIHAASVSADSVTVSDNQVTGYSASASSYPTIVPVGVSGGAGIAATGAVSLVNSTLSDNILHPNLVTGAPATLIPNQGAAVLAGTLALDQVTIADNAGAASLQATQLTSHRSVAIAPQGQVVCGIPSTDRGSSYNWFSDASCAFRARTNQQIDAEFLLMALAENGGPVPTRLPATGSVLIDHVPLSACPIRADARGVSRPQAAACDIGAVEVEPVPGPAPDPLPDNDTRYVDRPNAP